MNYYLLAYGILWAGAGLAWVFYLITLEDIKITRENKMAKKRQKHGLEITQLDYK
jgi:hypothetical protein